jgi:hypothetical protein
VTTLAQASLALQTARSIPPRFAPGLSTTHGGFTTGDPASPRTGLAPAGRPELVAPLRHVDLPFFMSAGAVSAHVPITQPRGGCRVPPVGRRFARSCTSSGRPRSHCRSGRAPGVSSPGPGLPVGREDARAESGGASPAMRFRPEAGPGRAEGRRSDDGRARREERIDRFQGSGAVKSTLCFLVSSLRIDGGPRRYGYQAAVGGDQGPIRRLLPVGRVSTRVRARAAAERSRGATMASCRTRPAGAASCAHGRSRTATAACVADRG